MRISGFPFDLESVIATVAWIEEVARRSGATRSHDLEQKFRPSSIRLRNDHNGLQTSGLFSRYRRAAIVPSPIMLREVDGVLPGTAQIWSTELFERLRHPGVGPVERNRALFALPSEPYRMVFSARSESPIGPILRRKITPSILRRLGLFGDVPTLAALLALSDEVIEDGSDELRCAAAYAIVDAVITVCMGKPYLCVASLLGARVQQQYIDRLHFFGGQLDMANFNFEFAAQELCMLKHACEDRQGIEFTSGQQRKFLSLLLNDTRGLGFSPLLKPSFLRADGTVVHVHPDGLAHPPRGPTIAMLSGWRSGESSPQLAPRAIDAIKSALGDYWRAPT